MKHTAYFIQDCSNDSELLSYYAEREYKLRKAGKEIKKAITETGFIGWFPFTLKNLNNKNYFSVQRMNYYRYKFCY